MDFRVTVGLGQDSIDPDVLDHRATALQRCLPQTAEVVVDVVKATLQVVLALHVDDALDAAEQAVQTTARALRDAQLDRPTSIVSVEAEAVAARVTDVRPHPAP